MSIERKLKERYLNTVQNSTKPEVHARAYREFLVESYKLKDDQRIFVDLQAEPYVNGLEALISYILNEISVKDLYILVLEKCVKLYIKNLKDFNLISEDKSAIIDKLCDEVIFEVIKGADTLGKSSKRLYCGMQGMTVKEKLKLRKQDNVAYTVWFNILEKLHKHFKLPAVNKFSTCFPPYSLARVGHSVLLENNFTKFNLEPEEFKKYKKLCQ